MQTYDLRGLSIICNPSRPTISKLLNRTIIIKKNKGGKNPIKKKEGNIDMFSFSWTPP